MTIKKGQNMISWQKNQKSDEGQGRKSNGKKQKKKKQ